MMNTTPQGNNWYMRHLATRYGSGLASEAGPSGGSRFAEELIDHYAVAGQVMSPELAENVRRYDALVRNESLLAQTTPNARAALAGAGYDPLAVRTEAADLRRRIYEQSADARNLGDRLEMDMQRQRLAAMELETQRLYATQAARVQAELAQLNAARLEATGQATSLEMSARATAAIRHSQDAGLDLQQLEEIFASNDSALMQAAFGTTSRATAYDALRAARAMNRQDMAEQVEGMSAAVNLQATELASAYDADALNAMLNDPAQRPPNVSDMAIMGALGEHAAAMEGQAQYTAALAQGITDQQQLQELALNAARSDEILASLHSAIAASGGTMSVEQLASATSGAGLNALATTLLAATHNGQMPVTLTVGGQQVPIAAGVLLDHYAQRMQRADADTAMRIVAAHDLQVAMAEHTETERQITTMQGLLGIPIPQELRIGVDRMTADARLLLTEASRPGTSPEMRAQLMQGYETQMQNTRQVIVDYARSRGVSEAVLNDVAAGRFMSRETYVGSIMQALGPHAASSDSLIATAARGYFESVGVTPEMLQEWATSGSEDVEEIGRSWTGRRVTRAGLANAVESSIQQVVAVAAMNEIAQGEAFQRLPPAARAAMDEAVNWEAALEAGVSPALQLQRVYAGLRVVDEILAREDQMRIDSGQQQAPTYQRGRIVAQFNHGLMQNDVVRNALTNGGHMTGGDMALLSEFVGARRGGQQFGEGAGSFNELPNVATEIVMGAIRSQMGTSTTVPIAGVVRAVQRDTGTALMSSLSVGDRLHGDYSDMDRAIVEQAGLSMFVRKAIDPTRDQSTIFGIALPSFGSNIGLTSRPARSWSYATATREELAAEVEAMGHADLAARLRR